MGAFSHKSVLLAESIDALNIRSYGIYVDGTLGGGGHAFEIAARLQDGHLYGIDRDGDAILAATKRLEPYADRVTIIRSNYTAMREELAARGVKKVDGILLDLGVSSYQIDEAKRGFSYMKEDAILDMRMDVRQTLTARTIVNTYDEKELADILQIYGEERFAKAIAGNIVAAREQKEITTAGELNAVIERSIPAKYKRSGGHPAKRTYQALRIVVNDELSNIQYAIEDMIGLLAEGGRLCIITFHSLEDRIVKQAFRKAQDPCTCPKDFPVCVCGKKPKGRIITRKPVTPTGEEIAANSRAKSAKLRVFERGTGA